MSVLTDTKTNSDFENVWKIGILDSLIKGTGKFERRDEQNCKGKGNSLALPVPPSGVESFRGVII